MKNSFDAPFSKTLPDFLADAPKSRQEYRQRRSETEEEKKKLLVKDGLRVIDLGHQWMEKRHTAEYLLREKMTLFWHNHFVSV